MTEIEAKVIGLIEDMIELYDEDTIRIVLKEFQSGGVEAALEAIEDLVQNVHPIKKPPMPE